ncbi:MAG: preprotein translocase subunit SecA [Candidatus Omnitrophica bacterium]|nr:preprotein translocase subunit SecA [Candidatus Omnitrophota bacterium]MDD5770628.1 preprotein translocase subunit SecA [Candidatus Omnitrophota bacterium]
MNKMVELARLVNLVNSLEPRVSRFTDAELRAKTDEFRGRLKDKSAQVEQELEVLQQAMFSVAIPEEKEKLKEKLKLSRNRIFEDVLPEAFAVVREASRRTIGLRHFDVQIAGGIILHEGRIAEMSTGEGKTLVATLPAYLNALLGRGVHIVTVNDYLARRDREWMGPVFEFLGLSVGAIQHDMPDEERKFAYSCDITYGTNNEFGFDYLRDNMKYSTQELVQRPFYYAIVDEVDSILIDEARTPLIISGPAEESTEKYYTAKRIVSGLTGRRVTEKDEIDAKYKGVDLGQGFDYIADEKAQTVALTEDGEVKAAKSWGVESLHTLETIEYRHHTIQALRAKEFFQRDVDYVVKDGQVIIVDEFTGRLMPGRRWSDGLHQAVESKEGLKIERENQTLATITFQNYFRMYEKLAGMTGTAFTEANEFRNIYQLDVVVLPTNRPLVRKNYPDRIYKTEEEKFAAVVEEIVELYNAGKPVLVGTITIDKSETLSEMLKRKGVPHQVLNAKYHKLEAEIIAQAGRYKGVTIATNMAGRGTDILLGGNPESIARNVAKQKLNPEDQNYQDEYRLMLERYRSECAVEHKRVVDLGGLHVLGTERHEARRIDNQLRGRSGRQGDPGSSRFYVSLGDDLMRLFGSDRIIGLMDRLGLEEGQVIEHPWVTGSIEIAQRRVEQHNFEIRKQLLEYDNVMNKQREIIYGQRSQILEGLSLKDNIAGIINKLIEAALPVYKQQDSLTIDVPGLINAISLKFGLELDTQGFEGLGEAEIKERLYAELFKAYESKEKEIGPELMRSLEGMVFLQIIDSKWKDHLYAMDSLREGIGLRAYGQRDPLIEYKREAFEMFGQMISSIEEEAVENIFKLQPARPDRFRGVFSSVPQELSHPEAVNFQPPAEANASQPDPVLQKADPTAKTVRPQHAKVGRNDPCPCGSGKKYKKCCGK